MRGPHSVAILIRLVCEKYNEEAGIDEIAAGINVGGRTINNLRYADDTTLLGETAYDLMCLIIEVKK